MKKMVGKKNAAWWKAGLGPKWDQLGRMDNDKGGYGNHYGDDANEALARSSSGDTSSVPPVISTLYSINDGSPAFTLTSPFSFDPSAFAFNPPDCSSSGDSQAVHKRLVAEFNQDAD